MVPDMLARFDARTIGDLVSDAGVQVNPTNLQTNNNLLVALATSAGMINSAILVAGRYTVDQLQALTGDDQQFLFTLNCNLAFGLLNLRRGNDARAFPAYVEALAQLQQLRDGVRIFNTPGAIQSGTPVLTFPALSIYPTLGLTVDRAKCFPTRRPQFRQGPG